MAFSWTNPLSSGGTSTTPSISIPSAPTPSLPCGTNPALESSNEMKDAMGDLMKGGKDALGDLSSKFSEFTSKLNEFKPEIPSNPKLTDFIDRMKNSETAQDFAAAKAEMTEKFGEAWDGMNDELKKLGIDSFPPTYNETSTFLSNETGIDMGALASGDFSSLEAYQAKMCEPVWDDNLGEYVTPDGCTGGAPPDISGILSGDFSSLGIEMPSDTNALCDAIPKLEEVEVEEQKKNESGEYVTVKVKKPFEFPDFSKVATEVPTTPPGQVKSSISEYIEAVGYYQQAKQERGKQYALDFTNKVVPYLESIGEWPDETAVSPRVYKEEKSRIEREMNHAWFYVNRPIVANIVGLTYEEYLIRTKKTQGFSAIQLEKFVAKYLDSVGIGGSYYFDYLVEAYNGLNQTTLDFNTMMKNYFINKYPLEEESYF